LEDCLLSPFLISFITASLLFAKPASILNFKTSFHVSSSISRMSFFAINYSDFVYDSHQNPVIESPSDAEPEMLQRATEQLEIATRRLPP
jgi:hypothetical protein